MLDKNRKEFLQKLRRKMQRLNYSESTISSYSHYLNEFLNSVNCSPTKLNRYHLDKYLTSYNYSSISKQNQIISSLKFFWEKVLQKNLYKVDVKRPRREKKLPRVIEKQKLLNGIKNCENLKHKAILTIMYSVGLRVSEVCNLSIEDIDSSRMLIHVRQAKGKKDRYVPLSESTLMTLRTYYKYYRPKEFLFEGQSKGKYSATSIRKIVQKHIGNFYHPHLIRHSSATTMLESGTDITTIQNILGHAHISTTSIYLHISKEHLHKATLPI